MLDKCDYSYNHNFSYQKFLLTPNFETRLRLHINFYIIGRPFNVYTFCNLYTEILSYSKATNICEMGNNPDSHLVRVLFCLFLYLRSN